MAPSRLRTLRPELASSLIKPLKVRPIPKPFSSNTASSAVSRYLSRCPSPTMEFSNLRPKILPSKWVEQLATVSAPMSTRPWPPLART